MPRYRVFYLKAELSKRFRELPAASVRRQLRPRDYTEGGELEAANEYAAWQALRSADAGAPVEQAARRPFAVGDVIEPEGGKPLLCLYGGFEEATWWVPEAVPAGVGEGAAGPEPAGPPKPGAGAAPPSEPNSGSPPDPS